MKYEEIKEFSLGNRTKIEEIITVIGDALELRKSLNKRTLIIPIKSFSLKPEEVRGVLNTHFSNSMKVWIEYENDDIEISIKDATSVMDLYKQIRNHSRQGEQKSSGGKTFFIEKKGETFFYEGVDMRLQKRFDYVKAFDVLYECMNEGGFCKYIEFERIFKKRHRKLYLSVVTRSGGLQKWIQKNLTEKENGFLRKIQNKSLIETRRGEGLMFNNRKS